jgi:hypothetical protein
MKPCFDFNPASALKKNGRESYSKVFLNPDGIKAQHTGKKREVKNR